MPCNSAREEKRYDIAFFLFSTLLCFVVLNPTILIQVTQYLSLCVLLFNNNNINNKANGLLNNWLMKAYIANIKKIEHLLSIQGIISHTKDRH